MYRISYYFMHLFSDGLDRTSEAVTFEGAVSAARGNVRAAMGGAAHAVITSEYGKLLATVVKSKGRVLTKKSKG